MIRKYLFAILASAIFAFLLLAVGCEMTNSPGAYTLTTTATPGEGGTVTPPGGEYETGRELEITAEPAGGYRFVEWGGDLQGTENPASLTIDADKEARAVFELKEYALQIDTRGEGRVKEEVVEEAGKTDYEHGTRVRLTAEAAAGWTFERWEGDLEGTENPAAIEVVEEKKVTAVFGRSEYTLDIQTEGKGSVAEEIAEEKKKPGGVEQKRKTSAGAVPDRPDGKTFGGGNVHGAANPVQSGSTAKKKVRNGSGYEQGTRVRLTAEADSGWKFLRWQDDLDGTANPETIEMNEDKKVTAVFEEQEEQGEITISTREVSEITAASAVGGGEISDDGGMRITARGVCWSRSSLPETGDNCTNDGDGIGAYASNLTGLDPGTTYYVRAYGINSAGTAYGNERSFTTEEQAPEEYVIDISSEGEGSVSLDPDQHRYESGREVSLSAEAEEGWRFVRWEGDLESEDNPETLTMDGDKRITAVFEPVTFTVGVTVEGEGDIILNPDRERYEAGEQVMLTAEPEPGWQFTRWEGAVESEENPETLIVEEDTGVTAVFETVTVPSDETVSHGYVEGITPSDGPRFAERTYPTVQADWEGPGGDKRWLARNLGASKDPESFDDTDPAGNGWYFKFDMKQGYYHNGEPMIQGGSIIPSGSFIIGQQQLSDWEPQNDPCTLLLGGTWRVPTIEEWEAYHKAPESRGGMGGGGARAAYNSDLKLHISGSLDFHNAGSHNPSPGLYWSSDSDESPEGSEGSGAGKFLYLADNGDGGTSGGRGKNQALSLRCIEE